MRTQLVPTCRSRQDTIDSYKAEAAEVTPFIRTDKHALHEADIGMEFIGRLIAGNQIRSYSAEICIGSSYEAVEIRNRGGISAVRLRACRISGSRCAFHRTRKEKVLMRSWTYVGAGERQ